MIPLTLAEIAAAVGGAAASTPTRPTVGHRRRSSSTPARSRPGGLFVAFAGEQVDGHDFAAAAIAAGAVGVLGTRRSTGVPTVRGRRPAGRAGRAGPRRGRPAARADRRRADRLVRQDHHQGPASASCWPGSARRWRRPGRSTTSWASRTRCCRPTAETRFLVLEMGARGIGHIALPVRDRAAADRRGAQRRRRRTSASSARSRRSPQAKGELVEALPADGRGGAQRRRPAGTRRWPARTAARVVLRRRGAGRRRAGRRTSRWTTRGRASYTLVTPAESAPVRLGVGRAAPGRQHARRGGGGARRRACRWPTWRRRWASCGWCRRRRMDVFDRADGVTVIDDSYNANPASTAAALHALAAIGRRTAHDRGARLHGRARRATSGPGTRRSAGSPPSSAWTGWSWSASRPRRSTTARRRWRTGEESRCWSTDQAAADRAAAGRAASRRRRAGQGFAVPHLGRGRRAAC